MSRLTRSAEQADAELERYEKNKEKLHAEQEKIVRDWVFHLSNQELMRALRERLEEQMDLEETELRQILNQIEVRLLLERRFPDENL